MPTGSLEAMSDEMIRDRATGKTGRRVARLLQERGVSVRAASRSGAPSFGWTHRGAPHGRV
ncbi:putative NAD(P)H azoreductase [Streptomyces azureus]|uniref:Putative NAD(P)H azoreductase n=2 Tax=Streptomyces azureus TaxID=146537 RepID=A0A0K8PDB9_STRAJ|nr:putative NAD(P)H azoreductase [Streptomyces azureus]